MTNTLIVGSGFVGRALAARLAAAGESPVLASRRPPADPVAPWTPLDATDPDACKRVVDDIRPERMVLVHGPSDVTWCEDNPERAAAIHRDAAHHLTSAAADARTVLISTDNVFDGHSPLNSESASTVPANAYGRAKLLAEGIVEKMADSTVLRVSLIYGWESAETVKWLNFFASCAHRLQRGELVEAPDDQWTTPVLVDDVAAVTAAVLAFPAPRLLHLGGPDRISRAAWAETIAEGLRRPRSLVVRVPKAHGRYASRPTNTCLTSEHLDGCLAAWGLRVRGVTEGVEALNGVIS